MGIMRKIVLLGTAVLAASAFAAPSAQAQSVEITRESDPAHCSQALPCQLHLAGELEVRTHIFAIETTASDCVIEFTGAVNEDGAGAFTVNVLDHSGLNDCTITPCPSWPFQVQEVAGTLQLAAESCAQLSSGVGPFRCLVTQTIVPDPSSHSDWELNYGTDTAGVAHVMPRCEIAGQLHAEAQSAAEDLELTHL